MRHAPALALAVLGLAAGLSPLFSAFYDLGVWVPLGLAVILLAALTGIARPPPVTWPVALALTGVAGLGVWSLISTSWSDAVEQATVGANRWLSYAALLLLLVALIRRPREATVLLLAIGMGIAIVAGSVLVRMLGTNPGGLFLGGRLNAPLGYVNGQGCVAAMGCWLALALAERREPLLAGLGAAATVAMACLALLSQSRGAAIASFAALVIVLLAIPGVRRRVLALGFIGAGVAAASGRVLSLYSTGHAGLVTASAAHSAATTIAAWSGVVGVGWGIAMGLAHSVERRGGRVALRLGRGATVLTVLVAAIGAVAAVGRLAAIERTVRTQWHAFVHLSESGSSSNAAQTRLFSGAGNRYDYWRIAWRVFVSHPVSGVGAGNYPASYYRERRTSEAIENPHSLELQTLSELGLVGAVLLALVPAGAVLGARALRRAAGRSPTARTTMVAATGVAVVWLVDSSGDWMHLLPGVTAIALAATAVLCRSGGLPPGTEERLIVSDRLSALTMRRRVPELAGVAGVAILVVAGASLLRSGLAQLYLDDARGELAAHPAAAIADAGRALRLDAANLDAYYIKAAGQARFADAAAARSTLLAAAHEDPESFVTWTLLGDLEVRLRDFRAARAFYQRAHDLDPNDPTLSSLARKSGLTIAAKLNPPPRLVVGWSR